MEEYKSSLLEKIALLESFITSRETPNPPSTAPPTPQPLVSLSANNESLTTPNLQNQAPQSNQTATKSQQNPLPGETTNTVAASENPHSTITHSY